MDEKDYIEDACDTLKFQAIMYYTLGKHAIETIKEKIGWNGPTVPRDSRDDSDRDRSERR